MESIESRFLNLSFRLQSLHPFIQIGPGPSYLSCAGLAAGAGDVRVRTYISIIKRRRLCVWLQKIIFQKSLGSLKVESIIAF